MSKIRSKDTKPEMRIRKGLHALGYRYRLHDKRLPGKPDLVFPRYKTVVQVRGCFWHGHDCKDGHIPKSRKQYWVPKLSKNIARDASNDEKLKDLGWKIIVVWECECSSVEKTNIQLERISRFLKNSL